MNAEVCDGGTVGEWEGLGEVGVGLAVAFAEMRRNGGRGWRGEPQVGVEVRDGSWDRGSGWCAVLREGLRAVVCVHGLCVGWDGRLTGRPVCLWAPLG